MVQFAPACVQVGSFKFLLFQGVAYKKFKGLAAWHAGVGSLVLDCGRVVEIRIIAIAWGHLGSIPLEGIGKVRHLKFCWQPSTTLTLQALGGAVGVSFKQWCHFKTS